MTTEQRDTSLHGDSEKIAELQKAIAERDAKIVFMKKRIDALEEKLKVSSYEPRPRY